MMSKEEMETRRVIHAGNTAGIACLLEGQEITPENDKENYLCCSSLSCEGFLGRDILFLIEGEVLRHFSGDIGWLGNESPRNTAWDEIHIGKFEVVGIDSRTDLANIQIAVFTAAELLHWNISDWDLPEGAWDYEWILEMSDEEMENLREEEGI